MSYTVVWWRLLVYEVRCIVIISSPEKSLNSKRVNVVFFTRHSPFVPLCRVDDWLTKWSLEDEVDKSNSFPIHVLSQAVLWVTSWKINSLAFYLATSMNNCSDLQSWMFWIIQSTKLNLKCVTKFWLDKKNNSNRIMYASTRKVLN